MYRPLTILGNDIAWKTNAIAVVRVEQLPEAISVRDRKNFKATVVYVEQLLKDYAGSNKPKLSEGYRLNWYLEKYIELINTFEIDHIIYEQVQRLPNGKHMSNISMVEGILKLAAYKTETSVAGVSPTSVKLNLTGNGKATKDEIWVSLKETDRIDTSILQPEHWNKQNDHIRDAIAIADTWLYSGAY